jgi:hypothetical protein
MTLVIWYNKRNVLRSRDYQIWARGIAEWSGDQFHDPPALLPGKESLVYHPFIRRYIVWVTKERR